MCTDLLLTTILKTVHGVPSQQSSGEECPNLKEFGICLELVDWLSFALLPCQDFIWLFIDSMWPLLTYQDRIVFTNLRFSKRRADSLTPKIMTMSGCFRNLHVLISMSATLLGHHYKFLVAFSNMMHG